MCSEKHMDTKNEKHRVVQYILRFTYTQTLAYLRMYYAAHSNLAQMNVLQKNKVKNKVLHKRLATHETSRTAALCLMPVPYAFCLTSIVLAQKC